MKAEIEELNKFTRQLVTPLETISEVSIIKNLTIVKVQALISQLQEDRHFGQIGKEWTGKLKSEGVSIIGKIGNVILRLEIEKDNILENRKTLARERMKCDDCISLLKMIIQMKVKEVVEEKSCQREMILYSNGFRAFSSCQK